MAKEQCNETHDKCVLNCKRIRIKLDKEHWYEHVPKSAETSQEGKVTILWNQKVQTDRLNPNNQPDAIIRHNKQGNMCVNRCWQC